MKTTFGHWTLVAWQSVPISAPVGPSYCQFHSCTIQLVKMITARRFFFKLCLIFLYSNYYANGKYGLLLTILLSVNNEIK